MRALALHVVHEIPLRQVGFTASVVVDTLKKIYGTSSVGEVFKKAFINGHGTSELNGEEDKIVRCGIRRFNDMDVLPNYVKRAYFKRSI